MQLFVNVTVKIRHSFLFLWALIAMADQGTKKIAMAIFHLLIIVCVALHSISALSSFIPSWIFFQGAFQQKRRPWWWTAVATLRAIAWKCHLKRRRHKFYWKVFCSGAVCFGLDPSVLLLLSLVVRCVWHGFGVSTVTSSFLQHPALRGLFFPYWSHPELVEGI